MNVILKKGNTLSNSRLTLTNNNINGSKKNKEIKMSNELLLEFETAFRSVPITTLEDIRNRILVRIKNDPTLEKNSIPVFQKRADLYKTYIELRKEKTV